MGEPAQTSFFDQEEHHMKNKILSSILLLIFSAPSVFADYMITQQTTMQQGMTQESTVYAKGVRERRQSRVIYSDPKQNEAMAKMMPNLIEISQCDLKRNVTLSEAKKAYYIDYYEPPTATPTTKPQPAGKVVIKGTMTTSSVVTDSGKKQTMFGLPARWLKWVTTMETSADSCDGAMNTRMEQEGWFVQLRLESESCQVPASPVERRTGGCRPKMIVKSAQNPGFLLEGETRSYMDGKLVGTSNIKTTALSKATLDQALFEIPKGWTEVNDRQALMPSMSDMMRDAQTGTPQSPGLPSVMADKAVAINPISGSGASKVNEGSIQSYIMQKLSAAGIAGMPSTAGGGSAQNSISVEIKKVKESGASKIGGIFGKVTGTDASKIGDSEAEITVTVYGKDGKTVVATADGKQKVKGKADDAVKAALDQVLPGLIEKMK